MRFFFLIALGSFVAGDQGSNPDPAFFESRVP
jgi:hypothetical protein